MEEKLLDLRGLDLSEMDGRTRKVLEEIDSIVAMNLGKVVKINITPVG